MYCSTSPDNRFFLISSVPSSDARNRLAAVALTRHVVWIWKILFIPWNNMIIGLRFTFYVPPLLGFASSRWFMLNQVGPPSSRWVEAAAFPVCTKWSEWFQICLIYKKSSRDFHMYMSVTVYLLDGGNSIHICFESAKATRSLRHQTSSIIPVISVALAV